MFGKYLSQSVLLLSVTGGLVLLCYLHQDHVHSMLHTQQLRAKKVPPASITPHTHTPVFDQKPPNMISAAPPKRGSLSTCATFTLFTSPLFPSPSASQAENTAHQPLPLPSVITHTHTPPPQTYEQRTRRKKDSATAILDPSKKRSPNRMVVDEATSDDNSVVALSTAKVRIDGWM